MQVNISRRDGGRSDLGLQVAEIDPIVGDNVFYMLEIGRRSSHAQAAMSFIGATYLDDDPSTDIGQVKFQYGDNTIITLTFDLEEEEANAFYSFRSYKFITTIYIGGGNDVIKTLVAVPNTRMGARR